MFIALEILTEFSQQARSGRIPPDLDRTAADPQAEDDTDVRSRDPVVDAWARHAARANGFGD